MYVCVNPNSSDGMCRNSSSILRLHVRAMIDVCTLVYALRSFRHSALARPAGAGVRIMQRAAQYKYPPPDTPSPWLDARGGRRGNSKSWQTGWAERLGRAAEVLAVHRPRKAQKLQVIQTLHDRRGGAWGHSYWSI